jgi:putative membrane protein
MVGSGGAGRGGGEGPRTRDHLANERTLLAWVRVGLVLLAVGYSVDRLGVLEAARHLAPANALHPYGVGAAAAGSLLTAAALVRYLRQREAIEGARFRSQVSLDVVMIILVGVGGLALIVLVTR